MTASTYFTAGMRKMDVLGRMLEGGLVAVIRADQPGQARDIALACVAGGVTALEITFTTPGAADVIAKLNDEIGGGPCTIGAGTVLDPETARVAMLAGAKFIVSPSISQPTATLCNRYQVPYLPGAATIREIVEAMEMGASIVKVFPGETLGPAFIKAVKGPLPHAPLMPTGGVSLENAAEWFRAGCVVLGVGSSLTQAAKKGDYQAITALSREFIRVIENARNA